MRRLIDIVKVVEDEEVVAYQYFTESSTPGLILVNKRDRDFFHAVKSNDYEKSGNYYAARHKIKQCFETNEFPEKLMFAS